MSDNLFQGVVHLTQEQYETLKANGTITVDGVTVTYSDNALYVVDDPSSVLPVFQLDGTTLNIVADLPEFTLNNSTLVITNGQGE